MRGEPWQNKPFGTAWKTKMSRRVWKLNPGYIGGRQVGKVILQINTATLATPVL